MNVVDWRGLPASKTRALFARERGLWQRDLHWDTASTWETVERARTTWGLPGLVAQDERGAVAGWTFFFSENGMAQVGSLVSDSVAATAALVEHLIAVTPPEDGLSWFVADRAAGLDEVCEAQGITLETHHYLGRALDDRANGEAVSAGSAALPHVTHWRAEWEHDAAALLHRAYGSSGALFAPHDQPAEWLRYVHNLVSQPACGTVAPQLSQVLPGPDGLAALALVSLIAPQTAHLVQLAVDPSERGRGLAGTLLDMAMSASAAQGCRAMTLLVADGNVAARRLYAKHGFERMSRFVGATVRQPLRSTSDALVTGGATTRR